MAQKKKVLKPARTSHSASSVLMTELVLPSHTNSHGTIFGGVIMSWIDIAGAIAAQRHARNPVVTVSVDYLGFLVPIKIGYVVQIKARVSFVGRTSMEIEILVDAENPITGEKRRATQAYLTYVAVDEFGRPKKVPPLMPKTTEEKRQYEAAKTRREKRMEMIKTYNLDNC